MYVRSSLDRNNIQNRHMHRKALVKIDIHISALIPYILIEKYLKIIYLICSNYKKMYRVAT